MRKHISIVWVVAICVVAAVSTGAAGDESDFKAALAAAEAANKEAGALKNQWTTTAQTLAAANQAAVARDYDKAINLARQAEALARASIYQAKEQEEAWRAAVIR